MEVDWTPQYMGEDVDLIQLAKDLKKKAEDDRIGKILVGAVVLFERDILLVQRSGNDDFLPNYIEIPGGGLEKNEDVLTAMERELYEETRLNAAQILGYVGSFDAVSPGGNTVRQFSFLVRPTNNKVRLSAEHSGYLWWDIEKMKELEVMHMIPVMQTTLKEAVARLTEPHLPVR